MNLYLEIMFLQNYIPTSQNFPFILLLLINFKKSNKFSREYSYTIEQIFSYPP